MQVYETVSKVVALRLSTREHTIIIIMRWMVLNRLVIKDTRVSTPYQPNSISATLTTPLSANYKIHTFLKEPDEVFLEMQEFPQHWRRRRL